ncbi:hypothetical protein OG738_09220 [Amycolatopsis sp. NBC_01488]|uniref:hypothetical protein n=1 Tax=Amycolatopsis sp. NBC_01488 TaxID=2903563 RepID=UPI002E2E612F|nr:hypothetical protein [Amycolatopsis sp. NBC_01488]
MRIRIALSLGALVLAGGALTGGIALADQAPSAPTTARPTAPVPATSLTPAPTRAPIAVPAPRATTKAPQRVPRAVPAGPTGDLHLPAIGVL